MAHLLKTELKLKLLFAELKVQADRLNKDAHLTDEGKKMRWTTDHVPGIKTVAALKDIPAAHEHVDALVPAMEQHYEDAVQAILEMPTNATDSRRVAAELAATRMERAYAGLDVTRRASALVKQAVGGNDAARVLISDEILKDSVKSNSGSMKDLFHGLVVDYDETLKAAHKDVVRVRTAAAVLKYYLRCIDSQAATYAQQIDEPPATVSDAVEQWAETDFNVPGVPELKLPNAVDKGH